MSIDLATHELLALEQFLRDLQTALDRLLLRVELAMTVAVDEALADDDLEGAA